MQIAISCNGDIRLLINHEYLEKYCTDELNKAGRRAKSLPENHPSAVLARGRMDAFSEILMIIAQEVAYEREQV